MILFLGLGHILHGDPEKIEFEFYCVMVARLAYEYFLKELGHKYLNNENGDKCTLQRMRNILFEKRNCTINVDQNGDLLITNLDYCKPDDIYNRLVEMLHNLKKKGVNKVLWWNQRLIVLSNTNQYTQ